MQIVVEISKCTRGLGLRTLCTGTRQAGKLQHRARPVTFSPDLALLGLTKIAQLYQSRDWFLRVKESSVNEMQPFYLGLKLISKILKVTFADQ